MSIWGSMSASQRRWAAMGLAGAGLFGGAWLLTTDLPDSDPTTRRQAINEAILTDADTRQPTIDRLAAQLDQARADNARLADTLDRLEEQQNRLPDHLAEQVKRELGREAASERRVLESRIEQLETDLDRAVAATAKAAADEGPAETDEDKTSELPNAARPAAGPAIAQDATLPAAATPGVVRFPERDPQTIDRIDPAEVFRQAPSSPAATPRPAAPVKGAKAPESEEQATSVIRFIGVGDPTTEDHTEIPAEEGEIFRIPATSIFTGTLITGLDAPTGAQAQGEPIPVLLRLKKKAILPNRFQADVRECFVLLGAYGDLSSERAHMRGETMSCVLNDGTIVEQPLKAYAVGEDGKEGPRGRIVRRQGTFIARALLVGFLEAAANVFDKSDVLQVGSTGGLNVTGAQNAAYSVAGSAAGSALGRVADWYIEQAFQLFPVIEIDAGREIDVVLTQTFEMRLPTEAGS